MENWTIFHFLNMIILMSAASLYLRPKLAPQMFTIFLELVCCPRAWVLHLESSSFQSWVLLCHQTSLVFCPSHGVFWWSIGLLQMPIPCAEGLRQPMPSTNVPVVVYFSIHTLGNLQQYGSCCFLISHVSPNLWPERIFTFWVLTILCPAEGFC